MLDMVETYKIMSGASNVDRTTWFTPATATEGGRITIAAADSLNVKKPTARLDIRKNFFSVRVCEKWNSIPHAVKDSKNVGQFKRAYKRLYDLGQAA